MEKLSGTEEYLDGGYYLIAGKSVRQKANGLFWTPRTNRLVFKEMEALGHVAIDGRHWWPKDSEGAKKILSDRASKTVQPDTSFYTRQQSQHNQTEHHAPEHSQSCVDGTTTEDQPLNTGLLPHETPPDHSDSLPQS